MTLEETISRLERQYGAAAPLPASGAWELILWENVAYLANDARRAAAFDVLREQVGTGPEQILAASDGALLAVTRSGIAPERRVETLRRCATIILHELDGDLGPERLRDLRAAMKILRKFPGIGEPG